MKEFKAFTRFWLILFYFTYGKLVKVEFSGFLVWF